MILNMADSRGFKDYKFPEQEGCFVAVYKGSFWTTGRIINTCWQLADGTLIRCSLFPGKHSLYLGKTSNAIGEWKEGCAAELTLKRAASSGKVYLREIKFACLEQGE